VRPPPRLTVPYARSLGPVQTIHCLVPVPGPLVVREQMEGVSVEVATEVAQTYLASEGWGPLFRGKKKSACSNQCDEF
jgi:hypothetical protein